MVVGRDDIDGLDGERLVAVLREHGDQHVGHNLGLGLVRGRHLNQDIPGGEGDLGAVAVDDGGERADVAVGVENDGVYGGVADDVEVSSEVFVGLGDVSTPDKGLNSSALHRRTP